MKRFTIVVLALMLILTGCAAPLQEEKDMRAYQRIDMDEAMEMMANEQDYIILDVRTVEEYKLGHIPGAIVVPNELIEDAEIPELPRKDQLILVYCRSGNRSKQAAEKLARLGYTNIVEFGGIIDWPGETVSELNR